MVNLSLLLLQQRIVQQLLHLRTCKVTFHININTHPIEYVVRIKDEVRNRGVLATGPSDSLAGCAKKIILVVQVHSFAKHVEIKIFSLSFPLTLLWTLGFSDPCSFPSRISSPRERKLRIEKVVVLSLDPDST